MAFNFLGLKQQRKENKMTQQRLATEINKSKNTVSDYERGRCEPSSSTVLKLCTVFDKPLDFFIVEPINKHK